LLKAKGGIMIPVNIWKIYEIYDDNEMPDEEDREYRAPIPGALFPGKRCGVYFNLQALYFGLRGRRIMIWN
jgi:hypothetical protein